MKKVFLLVLLLFAFGAVAATADDPCLPAGDLHFVCGPKNAEDLVLVPATNWIIASGMASDAAIYLIDAQQKTWTQLYPADTAAARQNPVGQNPSRQNPVRHNMERYGACPGSPDPGNFISHGLNLQPGASGHSTLYVVGHGGREAIEVFDVDAKGPQPVLTWIGCVMLPEGMVANSVASLDDGTLFATVPLHPGRTIPEAVAGSATGAVYRWSPGDSGFTLVQGTELPYANGIEVSADGREFYVASSGLSTVVAYSNSQPARQLRTTELLEFIPDNLHRADDGSLITAGLVADDPECGNARGPAEFDLAVFAACPRPFIVQAIDPRSMQLRDLARGPANPNFSNITMAVPVGEELWIGTFAGDRVAYGVFTEQRKFSFVTRNGH